MASFDYDSIDLSAVPPEEEPARQFYYIARLRQWSRARSRELGRPLTYCLSTFGCQMNAHDSEKLSGILTDIGAVESDTEKADIVLYNTCTVRENADQRVYGRLGTLGALKKKNPGMLICLCGCMMQEPHVIEKIRKSYPFVDVIFGTMNNYKLAELLADRIDGEKPVIDIIEGKRRIVRDLPMQHKYSFKSGVNIMYGCNNFCSYCIVPYVTGREQSREPQDILQEIRNLADEGVREVMLLGQNVNSYGKTLPDRTSFARLLEMVEEIPGIARIRFMTPHPKDLSDDVIRVMARSKKICRHVHLPLQSGSDRILRAMNRHYDAETYLALVRRIREAMPDAAITTDIIVGFPGETEEDHQDTLRVVREAGYDGAYTFLYSKRTGTPAADMEGQVPADIAQRRFDELLGAVQDTAGQRTRRDVGKTMEVMVESEDDHLEGYVTGRLSNNKLVHFMGDRSQIGSLINVRLDEARGFYYMGTAVQ